MPKPKKSKPLAIRNSTAEFLTFAYQSKGDGVEVRVQDGTIWLSQKNMGLLFDTSSDNIGLHLKNIFKDNELSEISVTEDFSVTAADGKNYSTKHYNLDAIITAADREVLQNAGKVSAAIARHHAETEFELFRPIQDRLFRSDFDKQLIEIKTQSAQIKQAEKDAEKDKP